MKKMIVAIAVVGLFAAAAACSSKPAETSTTGTDTVKVDSTVTAPADTTKKDSVK